MVIKLITSWHLKNIQVPEGCICHLLQPSGTRNIKRIQIFWSYDAQKTKDIFVLKLRKRVCIVFYRHIILHLMVY